MTKDSIIIIPARMASTRFFGKPLAVINNKAMILHVIDKAKKADIGDVYIACSEREVFDAVTAYGAKAIMTDPNHPSGTDRIFEALSKIKGDYEYIINVQGDLPTIDPKLIKVALEVLKNNDKVDIATLAAKITAEEDKNNPNIVKPVISFTDKKDVGQALYFSRARVPYGNGDLYHHIGLYAYRKAALEKFVTLKPSNLEKRENLEQLRALENNMCIEIAIVDTIPFGVDTPEDLLVAEKIIQGKK